MGSVSSTAAPAAASMSPQEALTRQRIKDTAKAFEANFLSTAISGMFEGVKPDAPFGGGEGEDAFRSFLNEAMAKQIVSIAQQKYASHVSIAVRDPDVRKMLELYAQGTGQKMPMSATTPHGGSLAEQNGNLYQQASYVNGSPYTFQSSLPVLGGSPRRADVIYAFGHGHLGLTLAATTARIVADAVGGRPPVVALAPYSAARFG